MRMVSAWPRPGALFRAVCCSVLLLATSGIAQQGHQLGWVREGAILGTGAAFHGIAWWQSRTPTKAWVGTLDPRAVPVFDRGAIGQWDPAAHRGSDILFGAALGLSLATSILAQQGEKPLVPVVIVLESGFLAAGVTDVVKEVVRRPRPYLYDPAVPARYHRGVDDHHAFWSGHTANTAAITFSAAHLVQHSDASRGLKTATWIGAATVPAAMGWLRVRSGRHFPTDVLTGYAFGALVGWAVPYFHRRNQRTTTH